MKDDKTEVEVGEYQLPVVSFSGNPKNPTANPVSAFINALEEIIEYRGWTTNQLAMHSGLPVRFVSKVRRGEIEEQTVVEMMRLFAAAQSLGSA